MRLIVAMVVGSLLWACGAPQAGDSCADQPARCDSSRGQLECLAGTWVLEPCEGPSGCTSNGATACDTSQVTLGTRCPASAEGHQRCTGSPPVVAQCAAGTWTTLSSCSGTCAAVDGGVTCVAAGCNAQTCAGCCANGTCIDAPGNQQPQSCGLGGVTCATCGPGQVCGASFTCETAAGCGPSNCATCCSYGQCVPRTINTCGANGVACTNCAQLGLVCDVASATCLPSGSGGGTGGGTGGTGGGSDPCNGVPVAGQCLSSSVVRFCAVPTGQGTATVQTYSCPGGTSCITTGNGASCAPNGSCIQNDTRCPSANALETCNASGQWVSSSCPNGCQPSAVGGYCAAAATSATTTLTGTLLYERRLPLGNYTGWQNATNRPARGVLVIVQNGAKAWYDAEAVDATGHFAVQVPSAPQSTDKVLFIAWGGNGLNVTHAVMDPALGTGTFSTGQAGTGKRTWSWSQAVTSLANGGTTVITQAQGSGALALYDDLQNVITFDKSRHQGQDGKSVVAWFGLGTDWTCGACFMDSPGQGFETQLWITGQQTDQSYWSAAVNAHELGHWAMAAYGTSPNEGGSHTAGIPTFPGQAWSEGWATFHSSAVRNSAVYYDSQGGMFWIDLSTEQYADGSSLVAPTVAGGILQRMDENKVSAILWRVSGSSAGALQQIHNALSSPHMNTAPWPRGYTRHTWSVDANGNIVNASDTGQASLMLADELDALRCAGMSQATIDAATRPSTQYPYPSGSPVCRSGFCYGCAGTGGTCQSGKANAACGTGGVACSACGSTQSCTSGVCQ